MSTSQDAPVNDIKPTDNTTEDGTISNSDSAQTTDPSTVASGENTAPAPTSDTSTAAPGENTAPAPTSDTSTAAPGENTAPASSTTSDPSDDTDVQTQANEPEAPATDDTQTRLQNLENIVQMLELEVDAEGDQIEQQQEAIDVLERKIHNRRR